ncbi:MAG: DegT/DnrJ/EryC1/StrS family aminotransferase [Elusimicrobia bacterium]|nr:DegT/DnrJ/EryC1/StrS family aminotransferase [Elusimicrobiota bacterium]
MDNSKQQKILSEVLPKAIWEGEPFWGAWYTEEEIEAVVRVMRNSVHWNASPSKEIVRFEEAFAEYVGVNYALAINGAGTGLDMAVRCLSPEPGDEIISCAINFPGTHLAIIGQGSKLVIAEPDPKTFNIDPEDVKKRITPKTRAIVATHMNGLSVDMEALLRLAEEYPNPKYGPLKIIGDCSRACGGLYNGERVGKRGWINVFSFQRKKPISTLGEGGMITTDDVEVYKKIFRWRSFGDGVIWGTNYKMTHAQAAVGLIQLRRLDEINKLRIKLANQRTDLLRGIPELRPPHEPKGYKHVYSYYTLLTFPEWAGRRRDLLIQIMRDKYQVGSIIANPPTYLSNKLIWEHLKTQRTPLAEELGARLFCPCLHSLMTNKENEYVVAALAATVDEIKKQDN